MYNGLQKIEAVIDAIEKALPNQPDCNQLAKQMQLSVYEFRRIFAFVVGCPFSEYIRKRKISLAAIELLENKDADLGYLSEKYGYANPSAFTRAFYEHHGFSPSFCMKEKPEINLFTRPKFSFSLGGRETVPFRILQDEAFSICGFSAESDLSDTCCCEGVWNQFYETGADAAIEGDTLYVAYENRADSVTCTIGQRSDTGLQIPPSAWAVFKMRTVNDDAVNETYSKLLYEWLPSAGLSRNETLPTVEVYPVDMTEDDFPWEIRIPIEMEYKK